MFETANESLRSNKDTDLKVQPGKKSGTDPSLNLFQVSVVRSKRRPETHAVRNFSVGMAARFLQVFGNPQPKQHNKQLVALKARARSDNNYGQIRRQENIQEWMEHLELRLNAVCHVSPGSQLNAAGNKGNPLMPELSSVISPCNLSPLTPLGSVQASVHPAPSPNAPHPSASVLGSSFDQNSVSRLTPLPSTSSSKDTHSCLGTSDSSRRRRKSFASVRFGRSRSEEKLIESVAAAVTDSQYLEELQLKLHKESISSLHERLAERKVKNEEPKSIARPKSGGTHKKHLLRKKKNSTASTDNHQSVQFIDDSSIVNAPRSASTLSLCSLKESSISRCWSVRSRCEHYLEQYWQRVPVGDTDTTP